MIATEYVSQHSFKTEVNSAFENASFKFRAAEIPQ